MLDQLTAESFAGRLRDVFVVPTDAGPMELELAEVEDLGPGGFSRRAFALHFLGPLRPILPQAIYGLQNEAMGRLDIFLVPLGPRDGRMRYEAIFT